MNADATTVQGLLQAALGARSRGDVKEERRLLDEAVRAAPADPRAQNAVGLRALEDQRFVEARAAFAAATEADPGQAALWLNLAASQRALDDTDGEQASLEKLLALDQANFIAQLRSAELFQRIGRNASAAKHWNNVISLAAYADNPPPWVSNAVKVGRAFLETHNAAIDRIVGERIGDALEQAGPDAKRFRACVDHALGRRQVYLNQCAGVYYPFLPADEFFDRRLFPWFEALEAKTDAIRQEALALLRAAPESIRPYVRMEAGAPDDTWTALDGSLDWSACFLWEYGVRDEAVCALCPETAAAVAAVPQTHIPGKAPTAFFSILRPGAHIPPHTGVTNTRAIIHLPLVVPDDCWFRVGGETRTWVEGEAFGFDETIEHEARNGSTEPRIVLIFDVWNPHLSEDERKFYSTFIEVAADEEAR